MLEVSFHSEASPVAAEVLDRDQSKLEPPHPGFAGPPHKWGGKTLAPLDDDCPLVQQLLEAEVAEVISLLQPVQVDMGQLQTTGIDAYELERWTSHRRRRSRPSRHPAHEGGLAGAELAFQEDEVALAQAPAELLASRLGLDRRGRLTQSGRSRRASGARVSHRRRSPRRRVRRSSRRSVANRLF